MQGMMECTNNESFSSYLSADKAVALKVRVPLVSARDQRQHSVTHLQGK